MDATLVELLLTAPPADPTPRGSAVSVPVRALYDRRLNEQALSVLVFLAYQGNFAPDGWFSISHRQIAEFFGVARTTIIDRLTLLLEAGYVRKEQRRVDGRTTTNVYKVLYDPELRIEPEQRRSWQSRAAIYGVSAGPTPRISVVGATDTGVAPTDTGVVAADATTSMVSAVTTPHIYGVGPTDTLKESTSRIDSELTRKEEEEEEEESNEVLSAAGLAKMFVEKCLVKFGDAPTVSSADAAALAEALLPAGLAAKIIDIVLGRLDRKPLSVLVLKMTWRTVASRWAAAQQEGCRRWHEIPGLLEDRTADYRAPFARFVELWPRRSGLNGESTWTAFLGACRRAGDPERVLEAARGHLRGIEDPRFVAKAEKWLAQIAFSAPTPAAPPPEQSPPFPVAPGVAQPLATAWQTACRRLADPVLRRATLLPGSSDTEARVGCDTLFTHDWLASRLQQDLERELGRQVGHPIKLVLLPPAKSSG